MTAAACLPSSEGSPTPQSPRPAQARDRHKRVCVCVDEAGLCVRAVGGAGGHSSLPVVNKPKKPHIAGPQRLEARPSMHASNDPPQGCARGLTGHGHAPQHHNEEGLAHVELLVVNLPRPQGIVLCCPSCKHIGPEHGPNR